MGRHVLTLYHVLTLHHRLEKLETKIDRQQQYSRRNFLLVHRINENKDEDADELVLQTFNTEINIDIKLEQIDRTHRIDNLH